jgi:hypothetical protein
LELAPGEYITEITGKSGNVIDYLKVVSNTGKIAEIGGFEGGDF